MHPQLLLLMGHTARLELVFEPVVLGPLYTCIHTHGIQFSLEDVVLQVKLLHCRLQRTMQCGCWSYFCTCSRSVCLVKQNHLKSTSLYRLRRPCCTWQTAAWCTVR